MRPKSAPGPSEQTPLLRELEPVPTNDSTPDSVEEQSSKRNGSVVDEANTYTEGELEQQRSLEGRLQQYEGMPEVKKRMKYIFPALAIGVLLAAADQTITVASSDRVGSELDALNKTSWIASSYFLTLTCFQPLYGKLSDIFSRKGCLLFAYVIFGLGCLFCGFAQTFTQLILARAFAGIGGGGMTTIVSILLSDAIPLKERGTWQGYINIVWASGAAIGAPAGGLLADSIGWRYAFILQAPMCFLAFITVGLALKMPPSESEDSKKPWYRKVGRVDFLGAGILVAATLSLLIAMDRGSNVSWRDNWAIVPLSISIPLFGLFMFVETKVATEPFAPAHIMFQRSLFAAFLCNFFSFAGWFGALFYIPHYWQASVHGYTTSQAGLLMLPSIVAGVSGSLFGGYFMQRTGKYYWLSVAVYCNLVTGLFVILLCSGLVVQSTVGMCIGMAVCGFCNGVGVTTTLIALISNAAREDQAVATACSYMFRSLGSTTGVSLSATAANQTLRSSLAASLGSGKQADKIVEGVRRSLDFIKTLDPRTRDLVRVSYAQSTRAAFILQMCILVGGAVSATMIREKPLSK